MASLPQRTEVLIVGAGPTGLAAALALHRQGCEDIVIVDSSVAGEATSRALIVHAATLEACPFPPPLYYSFDVAVVLGSR